MALTPEDVVTKQFQHVRFKEGFDPDEVDDFLDEIVVEWRKTIAENEELKARVAELEAAAAAAPVAVVEAAPVAEAAAVVEEAPAPAAAAGSGAAASAGIIELAQRLHDEHVAEGQAQRDKLISDAQAQHDKLISDAQAQAASILADAEAKGRDEIARLDAERATLETRISELRQFERDYRSQLRGFIEEKLRDLDVAGATSGSSVSAS